MNLPSFPRPEMSVMAGRILGLVVLLSVAASSGAVIGIANAKDTETVTAAVQAEATPEVAQALETTLAVAEAPAQAVAAPASGSAAAGTAAAPKGRRVATPELVLNIPGLAGSGGPAAGGGTVKCSRFDDAKINWLLEQVAKTKAENPSLAGGADKLMGALQGALGKNMCASEAQAMLGQLCGDGAVVRVMNAMVDRLPFFIKPVVGNPCTADLVSVLNKVGKFVPGLSSEPS